MAWNNGFVDAIGFTSPNAKHPRVVCIEVKKSRADLLADVNASKYRKYEFGSSHCYLAGTLAAFGVRAIKDMPLAIQDLRFRGFPDNWGILLLPRSGNGKPKLVRAARQMRVPPPNELLSLSLRALNALANKGLRKVDLD